MPQLELVVPSREYLGAYAEALQRGWSADNMRPQARLEELEAIERDAEGFVARLTDREAKGGPIALPDGSRVARLPGYRLWMWDGEFCGSIGLRWQTGTSELPPHVLGHIGYAVVPWKQGRGYAKEALRLMLANAAAEGLAFVFITCDPENRASRRVIEANGGILVEHFVRGPQYGSTPSLRYRIDLTIHRGETMQGELFDRGLEIRRAVLGAEHVDKQLAAADDFTGPLQQLVTEYCWGAIWGRDGLPRKTRSLLNLAMISALNRPHELKAHVKGALRNGVTREEIREVLLQVAIYCGVPCAVDSFRVAREALAEVDAAAAKP